MPVGNLATEQHTSLRTVSLFRDPWCSLWDRNALPQAAVCRLSPHPSLPCSAAWSEVLWIHPSFLPHPGLPSAPLPAFPQHSGNTETCSYHKVGSIAIWGSRSPTRTERELIRHVDSALIYYFQRWARWENQATLYVNNSERVRSGTVHRKES